MEHEIVPTVNQIACQIQELEYVLATTLCDQCQQPATRFTTATRTAIDIHLDHPVLLHITVSVHHCTTCHRYFRAQPPFIRPNAIYTNRVIDKAVRSVTEDGLAMRCVPDRLARDFWVQPSEGSVRHWYSAYGAQHDFETDYQTWVVDEFSGILCVDEVYQDQLALLLAVDPAAPGGDRLVGYQLVHGEVSATDVERFLTHLKAVGIEPAEVVTDGSALYPTVLAKVWTDAAHQLCLFHETRHVTNAVMKVINRVRKQLPRAAPAAGARGGGILRDHPPTPDPDDAATQRWYWRQLQRREEIARVHDLADQGLSQRAIARQTGHHRKTIAQWLSQPVPDAPAGVPEHLSDLAAFPGPQQRQARRQQRRDCVYELRAQGLSYSEIARRVGVHRVTVKQWLQSDGVAVEIADAELLEDGFPAPPDPWASWDEVHQVREALGKHRFLLLRRPEHLSAEEEQIVQMLLASPAGATLQVARNFLVDWYRLWTDATGTRRTVEEARTRYAAWCTNPEYQALPQLQQVLERMTLTKFERMSQFLRNPEWEATNNGAERGGRAFRHRQAPHFNLRSTQAIEQAIVIAAINDKQRVTQTISWEGNRCSRGRKQRVAVVSHAMA